MHVTTSQPNPDVALMEALQAGNENAMCQLHKMYYRKVCYFAFTFVGNMQDAEDITVESFIKLWQRRGKFESLNAAKNFLYVTTRNGCLELIRHKKRRTANEEVLIHIMEASDDYVLNKIVNTELHAEILQYIEHLPKKPGLVLKELFVNGKEPADVSKELDMLPETVLTNKSRGLKILRKVFAKNDMLPLAASVAYLLVRTLLMDLPGVYSI